MLRRTSAAALTREQIRRPTLLQRPSLAPTDPATGAVLERRAHQQHVALQRDPTSKGIAALSGSRRRDPARLELPVRPALEPRRGEMERPRWGRGGEYPTWFAGAISPGGPRLPPYISPVIVAEAAELGAAAGCDDRVTESTAQSSPPASSIFRATER